MRKIQTKENLQKKQKKNQLIMGIVLISFLALSTAGYAFFSGTEEKTNNQIEYNGLKFEQQGNYWIVTINNIPHVFFKLPNEIFNTKINITSNMNSFTNKPLYINTQSPETYLLSTNMNPYVLRIQQACLNEENCTDNLPIKNCSTDNIIIFTDLQNSESQITQKENCIYLKGDYTKTTDAFLYKILNIN